MSGMVDSSGTLDGFEESMTKRPMYVDQHHSEFAFHRFSRLREKSILTDAVLQSSDDKRFNVHRIMMAGKSDYFFSSILNGDNHDTSIECAAPNDIYQLNVDAEALEMIVTFCYSSAVELTIDNVEGVLTGASELQIESLQMACIEMLENTLDDNNCIRLLEIAVKHDLSALKESALFIISEELPHINKLPEFYHLNGSEMFWLIEILSNCRDGIFGNLLDALDSAERAFFSMRPPILDGDNQSAFRAAFIAGFFEGQIYNSSITNLSNLHTVNCTTHKADAEKEAEPEPKIDVEQQHPPVQVLGVLRRETIQFHTFCEIEQKWEKLSKKIALTHTIESFRDAIMVPIDKQIAIFHLRNGCISRAQAFMLETSITESITLPNGIECANLALFCRLNDKIYCFPRTDQHFFYKFDPQSKVWSTDKIDCVMDARYIVGLKDELYFVGCGYNRLMVRSYHFGQKEWTARGNLRHENKDTGFKAITMNGSIYVVMSCFDSAKIYNGTEFLVQRFDENVEDWTIIKRIYYTHFVDYFHLDVIGNNLYLLYGDGEVQMYNEELNEWRKGPTIDSNVLDVSMCMIAAKPSDNWMHE